MWIRRWLKNKNDKSAYVKIFSRPVLVGKEDCQRHLRLNTTSCNWSYMLISIHYIKQLIIYIDFHTLHHAIDHILIFMHYIMQLIIYWFSYTILCKWSQILIFIHYIIHLIIYIDFHTLHHALDHILIFIHYIMQLIVYIDFDTLHHAIDHILIFMHCIMQLIIYWFSYTTSCTGSYIDFHTLHHALDHIYWFSYTKSCTWSYILIFILQDTFFIFARNCIMQLTMYIDFHTLITYKSWHSLYLYIIHWLTLIHHHDGDRYHIETSPSICSENQWTGFYMITASVWKGLTFTTGHVFYFCKQ